MKKFIGATIISSLMHLQADVVSIEDPRLKVIATTAPGTVYAADLAVGFWKCCQAARSLTRRKIYKIRLALQKRFRGRQAVRHESIFCFFPAARRKYICWVIDVNKNKSVLRQILKCSGYLLAGVIVILAGAYVYLAVQTGKPAAERMIFENEKKRPLVFAHRGGGGILPENTLEAFRYSAETGVDFLELDVHSTVDGTLVVMHDASVDRTTDGRGKVSDFKLAELKKLDAGYLFTNDSGATFPFRGKKIQVPTLQEIFDAFPQMKFNIEPKQAFPSITPPLCEMIRAHKMTDRVIVGSFRQTAISEFRAACPEVATSASPAEVSEFLAMQKTGIAASYSPPFQALQVPVSAGFLHVVDRDFIESAHRQNIQVHVWTINDADEMRRLLDIGVDGIMTDYPDRLLQIVGRKTETNIK